MPGGILETLQQQFVVGPDDAPLYRRLKGAMERTIATCGLADGAGFPGERVIADRLLLSRVTVRRALALLEEDGVLSRRQGARTEVAARVEKALPALTSFSEDLRARGILPGCRWLSKRIAWPSPGEALALGLRSGAEVVRMRRVRTADGVPIAVEQAAVPASLLPSPDLVGDSLYEALGRLGLQPQRALQRMRAEVATPGDAELLDCAEGSPVLYSERRCFLADDRVVEHCETRYRGDVYEFLLELRR
ncbi:MAG: GntR family transcriptional regulator [Amaricoccus sp.]|uniref:GntR family transcriptional regulator n=1 Tax=Amaricoccus sp. TaxID=1872485 RepID=UPI0039E22D5B